MVDVSEPLMCVCFGGAVSDCHLCHFSVKAPFLCSKLVQQKITTHQGLVNWLQAGGIILYDRVFKELSLSAYNL